MSIRFSAAGNSLIKSPTQPTVAIRGQTWRKQPSSQVTKPLPTQSGVLKFLLTSWHRLGKLLTSTAPDQSAGIALDGKMYMKSNGIGLGFDGTTYLNSGSGTGFPTN